MVKVSINNAKSCEENGNLSLVFLPKKPLPQSNHEKNIRQILTERPPDKHFFLTSTLENCRKQGMLEKLSQQEEPKQTTTCNAVSFTKSLNRKEQVKILYIT